MSNIDKVRKVAEALGPLREKLVFVGGAVIELNLDDDYVLRDKIRPTADVDTIVEVLGRSSYAKLEKELRALGFRHSLHSANEDGIQAICRFEIGHLFLDVMPTDSNILGFGNEWYSLAYKNAETHRLDNNLDILLVSAPYMMGTKMEAFLGRAKNDFYHHDMEDMVTLMDGRKTLLEEIEQNKEGLKAYLGEKFKKIHKNENFLESLTGHLSPYGSRTQARASRVKEIINKLVGEN